MVNKGEAVAYTVYVMHRLKQLYGDDADAFRPERWDPDVNNAVDLKNIGWGYLPFNGGPRICLGRKLLFPGILNCLQAGLTCLRGIRVARGQLCCCASITEIQEHRTGFEREEYRCWCRETRRNPCSCEYEWMSGQDDSVR